MRTFGEVYKDVFFHNPNYKFSGAIKQKTKEWFADDVITPMIFYGKPGAGKSTFSIALYRAIAKNFLWSLWVTSYEIDQEFITAMDSQSGKFEGDIIRKYSECDLLFIDDLGVERPTEKALRQYFAILDNRINNMKRTIITTNHTPETIGQFMGDRLASRLNWSTWIQFAKDDQRTIENLNKTKEKPFNEKVQPLYS